jgi:hypothetical protein
MPRVGVDPTIPAFERAKTVHALDRAATVIGDTYSILFMEYIIIKYKVRTTKQFARKYLIANSFGRKLFPSSYIFFFVCSCCSLYRVQRMMPRGVHRNNAKSVCNFFTFHHLSKLFCY